MGTYLNPGNKGFPKILRSEYVDKTGMIALINQTVGTMEKLSCMKKWYTDLNYKINGEVIFDYGK